MSERAEEETDEDYYGPIAQKYSRTNNPEVIERFGAETEPEDDEGEKTKGRKSRVITTKEFRRIQLAFLANLQRDILANGRLSWQYGSPLPEKDSEIQPLGDYPESPYSEDL